MNPILEATTLELLAQLCGILDDLERSQNFHYYYLAKLRSVVILFCLFVSRRGCYRNLSLST